MSGKTGKLVSERSQFARYVLLHGGNLSPQEILEKLEEFDRKIRERELVTSWTEYLQKQEKESE